MQIMVRRGQFTGSTIRVEKDDGGVWIQGVQEPVQRGVGTARGGGEGGRDRSVDGVIMSGSS